MARIEKWDEVHGNQAPDERMMAFLDSATDQYAILQLRRIEDTVYERFSSMRELERMGLEPDIDHYEVVYTAPLLPYKDQNTMLEELYAKFNVSRPDDFTGHSLSVSDIVALRQNGVVSCHYVDSIGFQELPGFLKPENYLKAAEMTAEALSAQQGSEAQKDSLFRFLKSTLSKQMGDTTVIVSTALEELSFLLYYHGCKMDFDEEYQIEENFPSLLGGAPCKGMRTFWIDEVDPENGSFRIASDAIVNTDQAIRQFIELIQSNLPEEDRRKPIDSSQIPIIMAQDQNDTYIHADTGWPLVVYYTRTTQVGENKSGQEISLEINIPE